MFCITEKKSRRVHPLETKLKAIRLREEEVLLYREVTEKLEICDPERVRVWMRTYRREGIGGLKKPRRGRPKNNLIPRAIAYCLLNAIDLLLAVTFIISP